MKLVKMEDVLLIINSNIKEIELSQEQITESLTELGMDSITFIQTIVALEEAFECEIPDSKLMLSEMDTVEKIIDVLQALYDESISDNAL